MKRFWLWALYWLNLLPTVPVRSTNSVKTISATPAWNDTKFHILWSLLGCAIHAGESTGSSELPLNGTHCKFASQWISELVSATLITICEEYRGHLTEYNSTTIQRSKQNTVVSLSHDRILLQEMPSSVYPPELFRRSQLGSRETQPTAANTSANFGEKSH